MSIKMERTRKEYQLMSGDINYINAVSEKYNLQPSDALSKIIADHKNSTLLESTLKKILLGVNNINKISEIQLEITNSICLKEDYQGTDFTARKEFTADLIKKAYEEIETKITGENIKKFDK